MEKYKIVADSSADTFEISGVPFDYAPLKIITAQKEFTDNENLDVKEMVDYLAASDKGDLEQLSKCRGEEKSINFMADFIEKAGCKIGKIRISHCFNLSAAQNLKEKLKTRLKKADITIHSAKALCSFYAEKGGLLVGFEKI